MILRLATLAGLIVVLGSCTAAPSPPEEPVKPTRPPIATALDTSEYVSVDKICLIAPTDVVNGLGLRVFSSGAILDENPSCLLTGRHEMNVQLFSETDRLTRAYEFPFPGEGHVPYFVEPLTIAGQPAARVQTDESGLRYGCMVVVGLSETSSLEVTTNNLESCPRVDQMAEAIVTKLAQE